jgi:hypothetical protein
MTPWEKIWLLVFLCMALGSAEEDILKYGAGIDRGLSIYLVYSLILSGLFFVLSGKHE